MVRTTSLRGFLLLYGLASMKRLRRRTLRYAGERQFLSSWLATVRQAAAADPAIGTEFAKLRNLVKGYGETYERGLTKYRAIHDAMIPRIGTAEAASELAAMLAAAEQDEEGIALSAALGKLSNSAGAQSNWQLFRERFGRPDIAFGNAVIGEGPACFSTISSPRCRPPI